MKNEIDAKAAEWVAREDAGPLSAEERQALQAWLSADSRHLGGYARMQAIMLHCERVYRGEAHVSSSVAARPLSFWQRAHRWRVPAMAASVALAAVLSLYFFDQRSGMHNTRIGEISRVALNDGSVITMNTDSRVRVSFDDGRRNIELLRGEAMFDVAKDKQRPFVVSAGETRVVAVGTSFKVRRTQAALNVLVSEGIVRVEEGAAPPIQLRAGDKALVPRRAEALVQKVDESEVNRELAWRDGMIAFSGETMDEVAQEFARYSAIRIRIADTEAAELRVVGLFSATDPIGFSRAAAQSMNLDVTQGDGEIVIRTKERKINH
ncbi:FecR family protein [Pseudoxanthomonas sp. 3HH-4]|uniref:FecR family protein n=1 Tax=Pseudoxanthomonas sp. 3HH-4 TaxID=1690214 RepID=UPI00114F7A0C|nr:FecR domain-containing protein [Pseudoxanthomonas sp. 3HH-4]TQM03695.1 FecR family protein [Pseudoxanthomonas sp. 3HH-4]